MGCCKYYFSVGQPEDLSTISGGNLPVLKRSCVKIFTPMGILTQQIPCEPQRGTAASDRLSISVINNFLFKYSRKQFPKGYEIL